MPTTRLTSAARGGSASPSHGQALDAARLHHAGRSSATRMPGRLTRPQAGTLGQPSSDSYAKGAENRAAAARLGTRGVVAEALREKHAEIRLAIHGLADRAASGDRAAALALIPWPNQGMGMPATSGSVEVSTPEGAMPLDALDTASLRALLASP